MLPPGGPTRNAASGAGGHVAEAIDTEDAGITRKPALRPAFVVPPRFPPRPPDD